ncbi:MAG: ABC transporter ATP-binding protein/permease [Cyanobium sp.]
MAGASPAFRDFLGEWQRQIRAFWLVDLAPLRGAALLMCAVLASLAGSGLLIGGASHLLRALLGAERLERAFPYLQPALALWHLPGEPWLLLGLIAGLGVLGVAWLPARLPRALRRRWWALLALLTLLVVATAVDVAFTEGNGAVMEALNARSAPRFWASALGLGAIYLLTLPLQYLNGCGQQCLGLVWRASATTALQRSYLRGYAYDRLERQASAGAARPIDNPDQRIAEDMNRVVFSSTDLLFGFYATLLSLAAYVLVLAKISAWLLVALAGATLIGNVSIAALVRRLAGLSVRQQGLEADYRYALMHLRSHAEGVAMLRGERAVSLGLLQRFQPLLANLERVIRWRELVSQSSGLYAFVMQFVPYVILAGAYFSGRLGLGPLTVASIAFGQVQIALSFLIDRADAFSGLFASLHRVSQLQRACGPRGSVPSGPAPVSHPQAQNALVCIEALSVGHPQGRGLLIEALQLRLAPGERLLISGPSGCGKTTLLRVLAGLLDPVQGSVLLPPERQWMLLPQQPYMPLGSLRLQLTFPRHRSAAADPQLRRLLARVGLAELAERYPSLDAEDDWARVLSGGEQQRLAIGRLLLYRPRLVLLDEATSATDLASESQLYRLLLEENFSLISVGHRPSLRAFHQHELRLDGRGGWQLLPIEA